MSGHEAMTYIEQIERLLNYHMTMRPTDTKDSAWIALWTRLAEDLIRLRDAEHEERTKR